MQQRTLLLIGCWLLPWTPTFGGAWLEVFGQPTVTGQIESVEVHDRLLYVSGPIFSAAGHRTRGLAVLNETIGSWSPVPLVLDQGFEHMKSFSRGTELSLYGAGRCCGDKLIRLSRDQMEEIDLGGPVTGLTVAQSESGAELIVTGQFGTDGIAIWDGTHWRFVSTSSSALQSPTILTRNGGEDVYAVSDDFLREVWRLDSNRTNAFRLPIPIRATSIGTLGENLIVCEDNSLQAAFGAFDGTNWSYPQLFWECGQMAQLPHPSGERLWIRTRGPSWTSLQAINKPAEIPVLPANGGLFKNIPLPGELAAVSSPQNRQSRQLAIWGRGGWRYPERSYRDEKPQLDILATHDNGATLHVLARFYEQDQQSFLAVAEFTDEGLGPAVRVPDDSISFLVAKDGAIYTGTEAGLWVRRSGKEIVIETPTRPFSLAQFGESDLYFSGCGSSVFRLSGDDSVSVVATMTDQSIQCQDALYLAGSQSNPRLYVVGNQFRSVSIPIQTYSIHLLVEDDLVNITPPEYADGQRATVGRLIVSVSRLNGTDQLMFGGGNTVFHHDGQAWAQLPPTPLGPLGGLAVAVSHAGKNCVYAAGGRRIQRYCEGEWDSPAELVFNSSIVQTGFTNTMFFLTMMATRFDGRPVLLVGGLFESAGSSIQTRSGIFDLDTVTRSGFEF